MAHLTVKEVIAMLLELPMDEELEVMIGDTIHGKVAKHSYVDESSGKPELVLRSCAFRVMNSAVDYDQTLGTLDQWMPKSVYGSLKHQIPENIWR